MNASPRRVTASLFDISSERLRRLAHATGLQGRADSIVSLFARLIDPWGHRAEADLPAWASYVGDDHTPIEFSATFAREPELRILLEPLGRTPSLASNRDAALTLLRSLASDYAIDLHRLERIQDLVCPAEPKGAFSVWLAVGFAGNRQPDFKVYLNPAAQGRSLAPAVVEETFVRLGFRSAWPVVSEHLLRRGADLDDLNYLSLDLSASPDARLKVYARHSWCTAADLERAASGASSHRAGDVKDFLSLVAPPGADVFEGRPPSTCYAFMGSEGDRPIAATTHFPINSYASDDGVVSRRVQAAMARFGVATEAYARAVAAFASRPLDRGIGMHSYVSFRRQRGDVRLTTYLAVEAYRPGTVESPGAGASESGIIESAVRVERAADVADHPFCRRLLREPFDPRYAARVLANIDVANGDELASCERSPTQPDGAPVAVTLEDEIRAARACVRNEARRLLSHLPSPKVCDDESSAPGARLRATLSAIFGAKDPREVGGASDTVKAMCMGLEHLLRDAIERSSEAVRDESHGLRDKLRSLEGNVTWRDQAATQAATWRGTHLATRAIFQFLDDLYALCYGGGPLSGPPIPLAPHKRTTARTDIART